MPNEITVTKWIAALRQGDDASAKELWHRYFQRLMNFARSRMGAISKAVYDEEDAAISTFRVLCENLKTGKYPDIADGDEFWRLMLTVAVRKISRRVEYESAAKRCDSSANRVDESLALAKESNQVAIEYQELLSKLNDPNLERVAVLKLDGYTNEEIATAINRTRRTVQRMLDLIRDLWREELVESRV
jgi:DNA-directed RNA polymerase specialized sigma24 family protein